MPKLNAVDCISPAINLTKTNLFKPFRWGFWLRVAVLGILTGEMSTGGGCNFNVPSGWNNQTHRSDSFAAGPLPHIDPHVLLAVLPVILLTFLVVGLLLMYIGSVCRFTLLEAVLNGQVSLRDGWDRWKVQGGRFFGFRILMGLAALVVIGAVAVVILAMIGVSSFKTGGQPSPAAILGIIFGFFMVFLLMLPFLLVYVLAKDFAVPVMALEGTTFSEAWRRVWAMIRAEFGSFAGYIGMKIVLAIAAGIIFGIIGLIVMLIVLLPIGGMGFLAVLAGKGAGMGINAGTITLIVAAAVVVIAIIVFVMGMISAPVTMFFPAYGLYFLAGRYPLLHDRLYPPPPVAPVVPEPGPEGPPPEMPLDVASI